MKELFKKKSVQVVFCICSVLLTAFCVYGFVQQVRTTHTRYVEEDFIAATQQLQRSPPGISRAETFVNRLQAINTHYAPEEVQRGLRDYISALQQSINAVKAGRDTKPYDQAIAASKERLIAACRKYECD